MNREVNILSDALCPLGMHDFYYKHNQRLLATQINVMFCSKNRFVFSDSEPFVSEASLTLIKSLFLSKNDAPFAHTQTILKNHTLITKALS